MNAQTLVLNPWMSPHRIATWQDGIVLVVTDKVDVLEVHDETCSSERLTLQVPSVVRLRKTIAPFKKGVKFSKTNVFARDDYQCCYCGVRFDPRQLNYDHVLPRSRGGVTDWTNIVTSCFDCNNRKKRNRTPAEAGLRMHFKPYRPKVLPMSRPHLRIANVPTAWRPYLEGAHAAIVATG